MKVVVNCKVKNRDYHLHLVFLEKSFPFAVSCGLACPLKPEGIKSCLFHQESVISLGAVRLRQGAQSVVGAGWVQVLPPLTKGGGRGWRGGPRSCLVFWWRGLSAGSKAMGRAPKWEETVRLQS